MKKLMAERKQQKGTAAVSEDQIGKPFVVMAGNIRQCLVCEGLFTRQTAPNHAQVICYPKTLAMTQNQKTAPSRELQVCETNA